MAYRRRSRFRKRGGFKRYRKGFPKFRSRRKRYRRYSNSRGGIRL